MSTRTVSGDARWAGIYRDVVRGMRSCFFCFDVASGVVGGNADVDVDVDAPAEAGGGGV